MAENLSKIIKIEDTDYNVNAVYSDEAKKVTNPLMVIKSTTGNKATDQKFEFDGATKDQAIDYVPADGGSFRGPVYLGNPINANEFITLGQIDNRITNLNGAPLCVWNTSLSGTKLEESLYSLEDDTKKLYKFTTITGTEADFYLLQGVLTSSNTKLTYELVNTISPALGWKTTGFAYTNVSGIIVVPDKYSGTYNNSTYNNPVRKIGASTFKGKTKIVSILLPDGETETESLQKGIREIENYAFQGCVGLKSIVIPNSVTSANTEGWFEGCTGLKSVILSKGKNFTSIGVKLFQNCASLTSIVIPANITSIGANAFNGCTNLKTVYYAGSSEQWSNISISSTGNEVLSSVSKVYNYTPTEVTPPTVGTPISLSEVSNGPLLYICTDEENSSLPASNKAFLKLPDTNEFVEISKSAVRLEAPEGATASGYYTYETLAAIIAGINARLDGLGGDALKLPTILPETNSVIIPETLNKEILGDTFKSDSVPTIQSLNTEISDIKNGTTVVGEASKATKDSEDLNIRQGYYRSASQNANKITISTTAPTSSTAGSIGDIIIVVEP